MNVFDLFHCHLLSVFDDASLHHRYRLTPSVQDLCLYRFFMARADEICGKSICHDTMEDREDKVWLKIGGIILSFI